MSDKILIDKIWGYGDNRDNHLSIRKREENCEDYGNELRGNEDKINNQDEDVRKYEFLFIFIILGLYCIVFGFLS